MAEVIINLDAIREPLRELCARSQRLKHLVVAALEKVEKDPSACRVLDEQIPDEILALGEAWLRVVEIIHQKHNYRMVYLQLQPSESTTHVIFLSAFRRQEGYPEIDWDRVQEQLAHLRGPEQ